MQFKTVLQDIKIGISLHLTLAIT